MRYLKSFESKWYEKYVDKGELKSFVESYLAYLIDEGFQVGINLERHEDDASVDLHLFKESTSFSEVDPYGDEDAYELFYWEDIKDQFVPFLQMFRREYTFRDLRLYPFYGNGSRLFSENTSSYEDLLSGKFKVEEELREIKITLIGKL